MPELDPQPLPPRPISIWRWLLMLVPSVPILAAPLIANALTRLPAEVASDEMIGTLTATFFSTLAISAVLSVVMGMHLEKWRHGGVQKISRAIGYGGEIFGFNLIIAFAGCATGAIGTIALHS